MKNNIYELKNIKFYYNNSFSLNIKNFTFGENKIYGICGNNGAGKTTLLKLLAFIIKPQDGEILFKNKSVDYKSIFFYRKKVSMCFQTPILLKRTVLSNIRYSMKINDFHENGEYKIDFLLDILNISDKSFIYKNYYELSYGEKKKASLLMILATKPDVLLLDELIDNLDNNTILGIENNIIKKKVISKTIILTGHNKDWIKKNSDSTIIIDNGSLYKHNI